MASSLPPAAGRLEATLPGAWWQSVISTQGSQQAPRAGALAAPWLRPACGGRRHAASLPQGTHGPQPSCHALKGSGIARRAALRLPLQPLPAGPPRGGGAALRSGRAACGASGKPLGSRARSRAAKQPRTSGCPGLGLPPPLVRHPLRIRCRLARPRPARSSLRAALTGLQSELGHSRAVRRRRSAGARPSRAQGCSPVRVGRLYSPPGTGPCGSDRRRERNAAPASQQAAAGRRRAAGAVLAIAQAPLQHHA